MKINKLETHDRLLTFQKQADYISQGCEECIRLRPSQFENHPFYIFAHARTEDDGVNKRLIWDPRLTKPKAQTNSMLFKSYPLKKEVKIIWMIPDRIMWSEYRAGLMTESKVILESIDSFLHNRDFLEKKEEDDLSEEIIIKIYNEISLEARAKKAASKPVISEASLTSLDLISSDP